MSNKEHVDGVEEGFSDDDDDVIDFEEDVVVEASEMDHDPLDDPQECCGKKMSCTKRAVRKVLGLTLVAIAAFMFSLVTLGVKTSIHGGMEFCGVLMFRSAVSWTINLFVMVFRRIPVTQMLGTKIKAPLLIILGLFGGFAQLFAFYSVSILSMADANVYMMTSPVFVFLLARLWLGDPIDYVDVISAAVCIIGVIFVSKPSAIFGCDETDDCGLTQYCGTDGSCTDCGDDIESSPTLLNTYTVENYTAYEICRGAESLTESMSMSNMSLTNHAFCETKYGLKTEVKTPDTDTCHEICLSTTDCGFFTSGFSGSSQLTCILYMGDACNITTHYSDIADLEGVQFTNQDNFPPELFRMLGEYREAEQSEKALAICLAILSAFAASFTYCVIRKIGHGIDGLVCVNYFAFISTVIALLGVAVLQPGTEDEPIPLPLHPEVWAAVVGMGVAGFLGQYSLTIGFQLEKPGPASVIRYMDVIFVFIWDAAFFDTVPGWNNYVGAVLVIAAAIGIVMNKSRKQKLGIKQQKPLINFGDCACCCRPQEGDDGGGEGAHDEPSKKALEKAAAGKRKSLPKAKGVAYVTDVEVDTAVVARAATAAVVVEDSSGSDNDGLEEMESTI